MNNILDKYKTKEEHILRKLSSESVLVNITGKHESNLSNGWYVVDVFDLGREFARGIPVTQECINNGYLDPISAECLEKYGISYLDVVDSTGDLQRLISVCDARSWVRLQDGLSLEAFNALKDIKPDQDPITLREHCIGMTGCELKEFNFFDPEVLETMASVMAEKEGITLDFNDHDFKIPAPPWLSLAKPEDYADDEWSEDVEVRPPFSCRKSHTDDYEILNEEEVRWGLLSQEEQEAIKGAEWSRTLDPDGGWTEWVESNLIFYRHGLIYQAKNKKRERVGLQSLGDMWHNTGGDWAYKIDHIALDGSHLLSNGSLVSEKSLIENNYVFHRNPRAPLSEWKPYEQLTLDDLPMVGVER